MNIQAYKMVFKHSLPIKDDKNFLKEFVKKISLEFNQLHISDDLAIFEIQPKKESFKPFIVIIDDNIIQFNLKEQVCYSEISRILNEVQDEITGSIVFEGSITKEQRFDDFNYLLKTDMKNVGVKFLGMEYKSSRSSLYKLSFSNEKNDILIIKVGTEIRTIKGNLNLEEDFNNIFGEFYNEVLPAAKEFLGGVI
ncbi:hypothetical protein BAU22_16845 [Bacillus sp. 4048]|uniref:hypothetical protein n=1 Tax=Bacillus TaxID=1386 RepID=UPI0008FDD3D7|nr:MULTISPECIES: hypothetical protein [Bacillus]OJD46189.1 hypothetical protein BAU22_16845 [Bacillus sp. 4048]TCD27559.1 hypothetical protein E0D84_28870 [Bacillus wiedmannii]